MKAISCLSEIEKLLGVPATTRNWNTIEKVVKILQQEGKQKIRDVVKRNIPAKRLAKWSYEFDDCRCGPVESSEKAVACCVGFLAPVTRQFLAHDRVAQVQEIAPSDLRRDNKYCV